MLVLEDFNPSELEGNDKDSMTPFQLRGLLDEVAWDEVCSFAQKAYNNDVIVVVTASNRNVLRLIHDINTGKSLMAPFTSNFPHYHLGRSDAKVEVNWIGGLGWDANSRIELLASKYPAAARTQHGMTQIEYVAN